MNIKPMKDCLFVRPAKAKETVGSIIVPDQAKNRPNEGEVVVSSVEDFKPGTRVLFGTYTGAKVEVDFEELLVLRKVDVLGRIEAI